MQMEFTTSVSDGESRKGMIRTNEIVFEMLLTFEVLCSLWRSIEKGFFQILLHFTRVPIH